MRSITTIIFTILYGISYCLYLVKYFPCSAFEYRIWVNGTFGIFTLFLFIDSQLKTEEQWHGQFHQIAFLTLILNFILIIAFYITDSLSGVIKIEIFTLSVLIISTFVLFSGIRHRLFKTNEK